MSLDRGRVVVRRQFQRDDLLSRLWVGHVAADDERGLWVWVADGSTYLDIGAADGRAFREVPFGEWGRVDKALREYRWRGEMLVFHPPGEAYSLWFLFDPDHSDPGGSDLGGSDPDGSDPDGSDLDGSEQPADAPALFAEESSPQESLPQESLPQESLRHESAVRRAGRRFRSWYVNLEEPAVRWQDGTAAGIDTIDYDLDIVVAPDRTWRWKDEDEFADHLAYPDTYWVDDAAAVRAEGERIVKLIEAGEFPFDDSRIDFRPDPTWTVPAVPPPGWDRPRARHPGPPITVDLGRSDVISDQLTSPSPRSASGRGEFG